MSSSIYVGIARPNLKILSRGLDLGRGSNFVGSTQISIKFFNISAALNLNQFLGDFRRGLNV